MRVGTAGHSDHHARKLRISDLAPVRRYAPQSPGEEDLTRDMPTGRFVLRGYSPLHDTEWQHEWVEKRAGELAAMAKAIADVLEEAVPGLLKQAADAEQRHRERLAQMEEESRRRKARERAEALQRARQAAKDELRQIVKAWNDAFAVEAFFTELSRRAAAVGDDERADLEARIRAARDLMGGRDAIARFLQWTGPDEAQPDDADAERDDDDDDIVDED